MSVRMHDLWQPGLRFREVGQWPLKWFLLAIAVGITAGGALALSLVRLSLSPMMGLAAVLGLPVLALLLYYPQLGLWLTAAVVPIERVGRFTGESEMYTVSLMRIVGLAALAALLLNRFLNKKGFVFGLPLFLYSIFVGFSLLSISYSDDLVKSVQMAVTFLGNLLFFFLIINLARDRRSIRAAILIWLVSSILTGVYASYDWHFGSGQTGGFTSAQGVDPPRGRNGEDRMSAVWEDQAELESLGDVTMRRSMGTTSHAMVFGINLILTLPFFAYAVRTTRSPWAKAALVLGAAFVSYNIFLTNTRSVLVIMAIVCLLCLIRGLVRLTVPVIAAGIVAVCVVLLIVPVDTYNRSLNFLQYSAERSASLRLRMALWQAGLEIISDHWLRGLGSGNEMAVLPYVKVDAPEPSNLHNEYLQTMMEVGVIPGLVFFGFVGVLLAKSFRAATAFREHPGLNDEYLFLVAAQIAMIAVLLYGLQVDVFHFPLKGWWLIAGIVFVLSFASKSISSAREAM
jgi:O-antigen ligase